MLKECKTKNDKKKGITTAAIEGKRKRVRQH